MTGASRRGRVGRKSPVRGGVRLEARIRTRMGDGALVEMTPAQIRADLEEGTQAGAKRVRKSPELTERRARPPRRDLLLEQPLHRRRHRRRGRALLRRLRQPGPGHPRQRSAVLRAVPLRRLARALPPRLLLQAGQGRHGLRAGRHAPGAVRDHRAARLRRHARPRPLHGARRPRSPTGRSSCRSAGSPRRGRPRKRPSSSPPTISSTWPTRWSRPASSSST